ncbi:MAG: hypothetical protein ACOC1K_06705 [Nanoarchaeota archaeon]
MKKYLNGFLVVLAITIFILAFAQFFNFTAEIGNKIYPIIQIINEITLLIGVILLFGLIFKKIREFCLSGLIIISFYFAFITWLTSILIVYPIYGLVGIAIGLIIAGVGVVPLAFIATILNGLWPSFWSLVILVFLTFFFRAIPIFIAQKSEKRLQKNNDFRDITR